MDLKERWLNVFGKLPTADSIWDKIESAYSEEHRAYHTLKHLEHCFNELDALKKELFEEERQIIELAIWFHDIIYLPKQDDNEEQSVKVFQEAAKALILSEFVMDQVSKFILETKHTNSNSELSDLGRLFLDLDLSILGQPRSIYEQYALQIRQEYEWVPIEVYVVKRAEILQQIKNKSSIYYTPDLRGKYELQAKTNLSRAIANLTYNGIDPRC